MSCWRHDWHFIGGGNECCGKCGELRRYRPFCERHYARIIFGSVVGIVVATALVQTLFGG